jgi:hypothetical protein
VFLLSRIVSRRFADLAAFRSVATVLTPGLNGLHEGPNQFVVFAFADFTARGFFL